MSTSSGLSPDPWRSLRQATPARIALGRAGGSLPTAEWLDFQLGHAMARDAVNLPLEAERLEEELISLGYESCVVRTQAADRATYLRRPDLGRRLDEPSRKLLKAQRENQPVHLSIVITDGLSALAIHRQAVPLLKLLLPRLDRDDWNIAPIVIARLGRVALQDDIGEAQGATISLILVGERAGLSSPDSLGAYLVHSPKVGNTDAMRNCVSNIRPEGLSHERACDLIAYLLRESRSRRISGVQLKDDRKASLGDTAAAPTLGSHDQR
jgi:ethanolamine ammonia-lyase small subunit